MRPTLKPGGIVDLHLLTANQPPDDGPLRLPGPAAAVSAVPVHGDVLDRLRTAGFIDARLVFHAQSPCFHAGGAELRETRIEAAKASGAA